MSYRQDIKIDFPPNFAVRWGHGRPNACFIENIFINNLKIQLDFVAEISKYVPYYEKIDVESKSDIEPCWKQNWFPPLDGMSLYTILARNKPKRYLEIGSGNSTKFACRAIRDHELGTYVTSIDPHPRAEIDQISNGVIRQGLEMVDLTIFDSLEINDVIFFDGSHRSFQNSDVTVFFIDILPRLKPGVIVGIHDIFWPGDYPEAWLDRYYNEQYLLGVYMLAQKNDFPLVFACNWMGKNHQESISQGLTDQLRKNIRAAGKGVTGGCCWFLSK